MKNSVLKDIKDFIVMRLNGAYGYCGIMESDEFVIINSGDDESGDIKIKIELIKEE